ncbi:hypothetical protein EMIT036CA2_20699 [Chryseobacterium sp. IT-36CA2]
MFIVSVNLKAESIFYGFTNKSSGRTLHISLKKRLNQLNFEV